MWNEPTNEQLAKLPKLYETEGIDLKDKIIHLHFFIGGTDLFIAEYDGDDTFWGFSILNGDYFNAEWGYIPFSELKEINVNGIEMDNDIYWQLKKAGDVEKIRKAQEHWG